jgi:hypothetical protein
MRNRIGRPSPALAISLIALFVALGGTGYAAIKINGKDIKDGTIAGKKLKGKTITAAKIKRNAIGAGQINESKLGPVPSATKAVSADTAGRASSAANADNAAKVTGRVVAAKKVGPTSAGDFNSARAAAPEIKLFGVGPLTLYGKCFASGGTLNGAIFIKTTQPGSVFTSSSSFLYGSPYLEPGTDEMQRYAYLMGVGSNSATSLPPSSSNVYAGAPDGSQFNGRIHIGVKSGTPANGNGPYGPGEVCIFSGSFDKLN